MALGDSYATTAELKTRLQIMVSGSDTQLAESLSAASRAVERYCNRQFNKTATATARVFYPDGSDVVDVDDFHTTTDLVVKTDEGDDGTFETTWASTDYQLEPINGIVNGESGWPYSRVVAVESRTFPILGYRTPVQVTAQWGWNAVPAGVKEASLISAEELFKLKEAPYGIVATDAFGVVRIRKNPYVCDLLHPYRRFPILVG